MISSEEVHVAKPFRNSHSGLKKSSHGGVLTFVGASEVKNQGEMLGVTWPSHSTSLKIKVKAFQVDTAF